MLHGDFVELKLLDINQKKDHLTFNNQNFYSMLFNHENFVISIRGNIAKLGEISYVSQNCESFLNYKPKELLLQKLGILLPEPISSTHNFYLKRFFEIGYSVKLNKINAAIMLKKYEDPIWINTFVKYYPSLGEEILYVGINSRSEIKNNIVILDSDFIIKYIASDILYDYNFDLNNYKKSKIDVPFYLICPNILKYFKIEKQFIYNKTNMEGDLNQVVLDLFIPPFFEALNKEISSMRSQSNDKSHEFEDEDDHDYGTVSNINLHKHSLIHTYRDMMFKIFTLYHHDKIDEIFEIVKSLYKLTFPGIEKAIYTIKVKIEFHNFTYKAKNNIIISDIKVLSHSHTENVDEIFIPQVELDDLCFQGKIYNKSRNIE